MGRLRARLSHVLWIGGTPDAGKTSAARTVAARRRTAIDHYDEADLRHHWRLASISADHAAFRRRNGSTLGSIPRRRTSSAIVALVS